MCPHSSQGLHNMKCSIPALVGDNALIGLIYSDTEYRNNYKDTLRDIHIQVRTYILYMFSRLWCEYEVAWFRQYSMSDG